MKAVVADDLEAILEFFHEGGVALTFDDNLSRQAIAEQLQSRKGLLYAVLFDTQQLRQLAPADPQIQSLRDSFVQAKEVRVEVEVTDPTGTPDRPLWARLILRLEGRPLMGLYDPVMLYVEDGWKFTTFFTHP